MVEPAGSPGSTPLTAEEQDDLIPYVANRGQLNRLEQSNILEAERWAFSRRRTDLLSLDFMRDLHRRMFGEVWRWAGNFRSSNKNIGDIDSTQVPTQLQRLNDDTGYWLVHETYPPDEIAARFHQRLTWIHPFPNGNGRHARLMTDLLLAQMDQPRFTWGAGKDLATAGVVRASYLEALRWADQQDFAPLLEFARL